MYSLISSHAAALTLYGPLEERLAGLAGRHAIMIPGRKVSAHQTEPLGPDGAQRGQVVAPQDGVHLQRRDTARSNTSGTGSEVRLHI